MSKLRIRRIDLPVDQVDSKVRDLIAGGGRLSSEILLQWRRASAIWTAANAGVEAADLIELTRGGMKSSSRLNPIMISFICQFLKASDSHLAFFEDVVTRLRDPVLSRSKSPYAVLGDDVFSYLPGGHHAHSTVANLLKDVWTWRLVGILTRHAWQLVGDWLHEDRIVALVKHSQHLIVGAWDGEGLVIVDWQ